MGNSLKLGHRVRIPQCINSFNQKPCFLHFVMTIACCSTRKREMLCQIVKKCEFTRHFCVGYPDWCHVLKYSILVIGVTRGEIFSPLNVRF